MSDAATYTFKIDGFTPESMPFGRLLEYYAEVKKMLGLADNIHLVSVIESCHASAFVVDRNQQSNLEKRFREINERKAPKNSLRAYDTINAMLREDATSGTFESSVGSKVIVFPGQSSYEDVLLKIRDAAAFTGELYHIAGTQGDAKIRINTDAYGVVFCTTTRDIAKALRGFLFEDVKVSGRGMWTRNEGQWTIDDFYITDFAPIKRESLRDAVNSIRSIGIRWPEDPLGEIDALEERGVINE